MLSALRHFPFNKETRGVCPVPLLINMFTLLQADSEWASIRKFSENASEAKVTEAKQKNGKKVSFLVFRLNPPSKQKTKP